MSKEGGGGSIFSVPLPRRCDVLSPNLQALTPVTEITAFDPVCEVGPGLDELCALGTCVGEAVEARAGTLRVVERISVT